MNPLKEHRIALSVLALHVVDRRAHDVDIELEGWTKLRTSTDTPQVFRNIIAGTTGKFMLGMSHIAFELPQDATAFRLLQGEL